MSTDDGTLVDLLEGMGFADPDKPLDPESVFYWEQTNGGAQKIANARYWLYSELAVYTSLAKFSHLHFYKIGATTRTHAPIDLVARELMRHYYYMHYLPRFDHSFKDRARCDMDKFLDKVMMNEEIAQTIKAAQQELDSK